MIANLIDCENCGEYHGPSDNCLQNALGCLKRSRDDLANAEKEINRLDLVHDELETKLAEAEAEVAELSRLAEHGNGPVLLGWMDAHKKAMDRLEAAEAKLDLVRDIAQSDLWIDDPVYGKLMEATTK